jgi:Serine/threonine protein phosphatase
MPITRHPTCPWQVIGESARGSSHVRKGTVNQDAYDWRPEDGSDLPLVLAVADGHGSSRYVRSDRGAQFAVQTATSVIREWLQGTDPHDLAQTKATAADRLPAAIERLWKDRVEAHLKANPLSEQEIALVPAGLADPEALQQHPERWTLYGSTLLATAVTEEFVLFLQIGDGDILVVSPDGEASHALPPQEELIGNYTTSLCLPDARRHFLVRMQRLEDPPAMILLSTDGYANSFSDEASFLQVGADILDVLRKEGAEAVDSALPSWLSHASEHGSGDDITVGILVYQPQMKAPRPSGQATATAATGSERNAESTLTIGALEPRSSAAAGKGPSLVVVSIVLLAALALALGVVLAYCLTALDIGRRAFEPPQTKQSVQELPPPPTTVFDRGTEPQGPTAPEKPHGTPNPGAPGGAGVPGQTIKSRPSDTKNQPTGGQ